MKKMDREEELRNENCLFVVFIDVTLLLFCYCFVIFDIVFVVVVYRKRFR